MSTYDCVFFAGQDEYFKFPNLNENEIIDCHSHENCRAVQHQIQILEDEGNRINQNSCITKIDQYDDNE